MPQADGFEATRAEAARKRERGVELGFGLVELLPLDLAETDAGMRDHLRAKRAAIAA